MVKNGTFASPAMARASRVLPVPGGPDQQHAARDAPAKPLKFSGIAEELDDLLQILLGFVDAGHVLERDSAMGFGQQLGAALSETERLAARSLHLSRQKYPHADQGDERQPRDQERHEPGHVVLLRAGGDRHALAVEALDQAGVIRRIGLEAAPVGEGAVDFRSLDQNVAHAALINLGQQLGEGNILGRRALSRILEQGEQREQQQNDDHPKGEIAQIGVHPVSFLAAGDTAARSYGNLQADSGPAPLQSRCRGASCQGNQLNSFYHATAGTKQHSRPFCPLQVVPLLNLNSASGAVSAGRGALDRKLAPLSRDQCSRQGAAPR